MADLNTLLPRFVRFCTPSPFACSSAASGEAAEGGTFETRDPVAARCWPGWPRGGAADVDRAVRAAREAFHRSGWGGACR